MKSLKILLIAVVLAFAATAVACDNYFRIPEHNVKFYNGTELIYEADVRGASFVNLKEAESKIVPENGYELEGFFTEDGTKFSKEMKLSSDAVFYAKYKLITYTITYDLGEGASSDNPTSYTVETETFTLSDPYGFDGELEFVGWTTDEDASPKKTVTVEKGATGNITFKAHYQETNKYYLYFDTTGGTEVDRLESYLPTFSIEGVTTEKVGYTFKGWYVDEARLIPAANTYVAISKSSTLYAGWTLVDYTITFENCELSTITYTIETETFTVPAPERDGYEFSGFTYDSVTKPVKQLTIPKGTHKNYELYANFTVKEYTITFNTLGGSEVSPMTAAYGATITAPDDPEKLNCDFLGWYTDEACRNKFTFTTMPAEDLTLYAGWYSDENRVLTYAVSGDVRASVVGNRSSGTKVLAGENVTLSVPAVTYGGVFSHWVYVKGGVWFHFSYDPELSFDMPTSNLNLLAVYEELPSFDYTIGGSALKVSSDQYTRIFGNSISGDDYSYTAASGTTISGDYLDGFSDGSYLFSAISDGAVNFIVTVSGTGDKLSYVKLDYDVSYPEVVLLFNETEGYNYEYRLNSAATYTECHSGMVLTDYSKTRTNTVTVRRVDDTSDSVSITKYYTATIATYYQSTFEYNGTTYDYVIEDENEFGAIMEYFAFVYAVNEDNRTSSTGNEGGEATMSFYIEQQFRSAFSANQQYYENYIFDTKGVPYSPSYSYNFNTASGVEKVTFYFVTKQLNTVASAQQKTEISSALALGLATQERDANFDDFAIEKYTRTQEIRSIYELENLAYGVRPSFGAHDTMAYEVYTEAKNVLRRYVADDMDDFQKVTAIYDFLAEMITYDYKVASLSNTKGIGKYSCFTTYGALVNRIAVCDGIAGAFRLLCLIEGIESEEIIGFSEAGGAIGGHAWNKVKLYGSWYGVDATWSTTTASEVTYVYHNNFMVDEVNLYVSGHRESASISGGSLEEGVVDVASFGPMTYYDVTIYGTELTRNVKIVDDLKKLVAHVKSIGGSALEFKNSSVREINELLGKVSGIKSYISIGNKCYIVFIE